jgi:hypothetical protein
MGLDLRMEWRGYANATAGVGKATARWGGPVLPAALFRLFDGTAAGQANDAAYTAFSVAFGAAFDWDLKGGAGEVNFNGQALSWQTLKCLMVVVTAPAAGKELRLGPQNRTNAAQLWFSGVDADSYVVARDLYWQSDPNAGWAIGASTKIVSLTNPAGSGDPITGYMIAAGVKT